MSDEFEREDEDKKFDILDLKKGNILDLETEEVVEDDLVDSEEDPTTSYNLYDNESREDGEYSY